MTSRKRLTRAFCTTVLLAAAGVMAAGCGNNKGASAVGEEPAVKQPAPMPVAKMLARDVGNGKPVAIFSGPGGIDAVSADGTRTMKLVTSPVAWATVDARSDVIWFGTTGEPSTANSAPAAATGEPPATTREPPAAPGAASTLKMLDLQQPTPSPVTIATNMPPDMEVGFAYFDGANLVERISSRASEYDGGVELRLGNGKPVFVYSEGALAAVDEEHTAEDRAAARKAAFTTDGLATLDALEKRATGNGLAQPTKKVELPRVAAVRSSNCEDKELCGMPEPVPGTRFWRVIVEQSCGDGCYTTYQMYDPATAEFFDLKSPAARSRTPTKDAASINEMWISGDGASAIFDGALYDFDKGLVKADLGRPAGWLAGQWYIN